ncbi:MAG: TonB-dependent receptor [candidate division WOR-3 bacterium]
MRQALISVLLFLILGVASAPVLTGALNGFIRDASSGEPLGYATVELKGTGLGTVTNNKGYFYLGDIPPGDYEVEVSFIGYETIQKKIKVAAERVLTLNLELKLAPVELGEVKVTAERARFEREVEVSTKRLDTRQMVVVPRLGGEIDILRTVQLLPGVITVSDFSNKLYIRGGSPDQNLILLDGITVYNPSHLFGVFSPFVPEAVADVTLLAGGFAAKYGSRLSSVLDVTTREGNSKKYTGEGSVSMIAAKGIVEGPLPNGSFLFAGRRTYLPDVLLKALGAPGLGYYFYDLMAKANYHHRDYSRFTFAGIWSEDVLSFWDPDQPEAFKARMTWGNRGISLRWHTIFTPVVYGELLAAWSNFFSGFNVKFEESGDVVMKGDLTGWTLKGDFTYYASDRHTIGFGFETQPNRMGLKIEFDTVRFTTQDTLIPIAIYCEDKWEIRPGKVFLKPGLRLSYYSNGNRFEPEPRLGGKFFIKKNTALNLSWGRFTQPLVTLNSTEPVFAIYDEWVPVPENRPIPSAYHYIAGVEHWLTPDLNVQIEGYYKDYNHLLETRYGEYFTPPESLLNAEGFSYGAELLFRKNSGKIQGWFSYSFMWTCRQIGTERYHPHYDRRHNCNLVLTFPALFLGFDLTSHWTLGTGLPYAGVIGYYPKEIERPGGEPAQEWNFIYGKRDAFRYPVYHRLDISLLKTWHRRWGEFTLFLDVINLYNARNVLLYYWDVSSSGLPERHQINMIPILPTLGIKARF